MIKCCTNSVETVFSSFVLDKSHFAGMTFTLAGLFIVVRNENSEPIERCPHPVCEALRGSHEGKVTVIFGTDPVQPDTLSNPCAPKQ